MSCLCLIFVLSIVYVLTMYSLDSCNILNNFKPPPHIIWPYIMFCIATFKYVTPPPLPYHMITHYVLRTSKNFSNLVIYEMCSENLTVSDRREGVREGDEKQCLMIIVEIWRNGAIIVHRSIDGIIIVINICSEIIPISRRNWRNNSLETES